MQPLCQKCRRPEDLLGMEPFYPLRAGVCEQCLLVQTPEVVPPEVLFTDYQYFSSYSDSWLAHAARYVDGAIARLSLGKSSFVVEVASNDGYLLKNLVCRGVPCLGVEPAPNVAEVAVAAGVPTLNAFFGEATAQQVLEEHGTADLLIGNNVLAHTPDLNGFVAGVRILLAEQGAASFEFPHLLRLIEQNQFDTIYHEHFSYFSLLAVKHVFERHDLRVFDVEELPTHGGSLRVWIARQESGRATEESVTHVLAAERAARLDRMDAYLGFGEKVAKLKRRLLSRLIEYQEQNLRVAGYGAPGKGAVLLNYCGIGPELLPYTVDRSPHKQGLYMPGVCIPIRSPRALISDQPDVVLILPWNLREEIAAQLVDLRRRGTKLFVPIPEPAEYTSN